MTKGRHWVALWLALLLAVLAWVIARQTASVVLARTVSQTRAERGAAEAEKAALLRRIREAQSRAVLMPRAESLGLRLPADSEMVILRMNVPENP